MPTRFPRLRIQEYCASRGARPFGPSLPCFFESAVGGNQIRPAPAIADACINRALSRLPPHSVTRPRPPAAATEELGVSCLDCLLWGRSVTAHLSTRASHSDAATGRPVPAVVILTELFAFFVFFCGEFSLSSAVARRAALQHSRGYSVGGAGDRPSSCLRVAQRRGYSSPYRRTDPSKKTSKKSENRS